jgi:hypothetical protein
VCVVTEKRMKDTLAVSGENTAATTAGGKVKEAPLTDEEIEELLTKLRWGAIESKGLVALGHFFWYLLQYFNNHSQGCGSAFI